MVSPSTQKAVVRNNLLVLWPIPRRESVEKKQKLNWHMRGSNPGQAREGGVHSNGAQAPL
jgi:hypothetical protein